MDENKAVNFSGHLNKKKLSILSNIFFGQEASLFLTYILSKNEMAHSIALETIRVKSVKDLRDSFTKQLKKTSKSDCSDSSPFLKWHFDLLRRAPEGTDPILPMLTLAVDVGDLFRSFETSLVNDGHKQLIACKLSSFLKKSYTKAAKGLEKQVSRSISAQTKRPKSEATQTQCTTFQYEEAITNVNVERDMGDSSRVVLEHEGRRLHIQSSHLIKLRMLHECPFISKASGKRRIDDSRTEEIFLVDLFKLLLRYKALDGGGFQCALPKIVFECLESCWGVEFEGFASPLNCHFGCSKYFSAFRDSDAPFGSLGSFFDAKLIRGSFELNPPFSADLYAALFDHCHGHLESAQRTSEALSFIVIVGATEKTLAHHSLEKFISSPFLRGRLHIKVQDHVYISGQQHLEGGDYSFRACDSGIFFLQSDAGAKKWPVSSEGLEKLRCSFLGSNI
jgi:phosphorylated CTD-interacting factor 1